MKNLLYVANVQALTPEKMAALVSSAKSVAEENEQVVINFLKGKQTLQGTTVTINEDIDEESVVKYNSEGVEFKVIDYQEAKKSVDSFDNILLVKSDEDLIKFVFIDFNLEGRKNVNLLDFEQEDPMQLIKNQQRQISLIYQNEQAMLSEIQDLKLRISSFMQVLPEEAKAKAGAIYEAQKKLIGTAVSKSTRFAEIVSTLEGNASIQEVLEMFEKDIAFENFAALAAREYFKLLDKEEDEDTLLMKHTKEELIEDRNLFNAVVVVLAR